MPESRRRKPKHTAATGRQKIAAIDGTVIRIRACCDVEVTIGHPYSGAAHDAHCRVPTDQTDLGRMRRLQVSLILREKLELHGIRSTVVTDRQGEHSMLMVFPDKEAAS